MTFTLLSELGRGGMGVVWRARDEETGQIVALKLLRAAYADDPDYLERFTRELELTRRIHSAHVVPVLGYGVREGLPYLALEYVDGPSLRELIREHGPYGWPEARDLLTGVAGGLADAHAAGIVHRDVKPSNILLGSDGLAKLTDFGVSRGLDLTRVTGTSTMLGTPAYLAPEGPADERSDLYSLGCVAYELLTGAVPFEGRSYQEVILRHVREAPDLAKLPPEARPVVGALLAKEPADRPHSAQALLGLLAGTTPLPVASGAAPYRATSAPTVPRRRRRGALFAAAAIAVAVLLVAVGTGLTAHPGASPSPDAPGASPAVAVVASAVPSPAGGTPSGTPPAESPSAGASATAAAGATPGLTAKPRPTARPTSAPTPTPTLRPTARPTLRPTPTPAPSIATLTPTPTPAPVPTTDSISSIHVVSDNVSNLTVGFDYSYTGDHGTNVFFAAFLDPPPTSFCLSAGCYPTSSEPNASIGFGTASITASIGSPSHNPGASYTSADVQICWFQLISGSTSSNTYMFNTCVSFPYVKTWPG